MKRILKPLTLVLIIGAGIWFVYVNRDKADYLQSIHAEHIFLLVVIGLVNISLNGYQLKVILQGFKLHLPFKEWFGLSAVNSMLNYYIPARGATIILAHYLKRKYNFDYSLYISVLSAYYMISFLVSALLGLIFSCTWGITRGDWPIEFLIIYSLLLCLTLLLGITLVYISRIRLDTRFKWFNNIVNRIAQGLLGIHGQKIFLVKLMGLAVISVFMFALQLYISFRAVGAQVNLIQILIIQCLASFSMILSITPANLGIREGIISVSARLLSLSMTASMMGAIVSRTMLMFVILITGIVFSRVLIYNRSVNEKVSTSDPDTTNHE